MQVTDSTNREKVLQALRQWGIPFALYEHPPVHTMDDCFLTEGVDWTKTEMPKNIFLCNRQKTTFYLMLLRHDVPFRTGTVSKALGVSRLSFAPDELLPEMLGLRAGAVSPLGLVHDPEKKVTLVIDRALRGYEYLGFHPCENTATVVLRGEDFFNGFLPKLGRAPIELEQVI